MAHSFIQLKKIKAGALQYTIFIAVLIALLLSAFISITHFQQQFQLQGKTLQQCIHHTALGIDYTSQNSIQPNKKTTLNFNNSNIQTTLIKKPWGLFEILNTTATFKNITFNSTALMGGFQNQKTTLYLNDNNLPLVLAGNSKIEGIAYLPKQGVKKGMVANKPYLNTKLIYGHTKQSNPSLPALKNQLYQLKQLPEFHTAYNYTNNLQVTNSFNNNPKVYTQNEAIDIENVQLTGNIIVQSETLIRVHPSSNLKDIILIAPTIEILKGVEGNFQAIASKSLQIAENCTLHYPSALILNNASRKTLENTPLKIASNTIVKGIVGYFTNGFKTSYTTQLLLSKNSKIIGEVYCKKNFELKGIVEGSVYTNAFIAHEKGIVYNNYIVDGKIIPTQLPIAFVGLKFNERLKEAKILY